MSKSKKQIAVSWKDFDRYGCVNCGCEFCFTQGMQGGGVSPVECGECGMHFVILADGVEKSTVGFQAPPENQEVPEGGGFVQAGSFCFSLDPKKPTAEAEGYYYPTREDHPRTGTPKHPYVRPDVKPEGGGEYWAPRGIGYDLSGFVKSKEAGERIVAMFRGALGREEIDTWLDYRENEPNWIQVKVQPSEADVEKLMALTQKTGIITAAIIAQVIKK